MIVLMLLLFRSSSCFLLTKSEPGLVLVSPGQQVSLTCGVDSHYEWCKWSNPGGRFCDFEWKRSEGNITMQECQLEDRVTFYGNYDDRECGITFTASEEDTGIWKCELEEYILLWSRGAGRIQAAEMNVTVKSTTTQAPGSTLQSVSTLQTITASTTVIPILTTVTLQTKTSRKITLTTLEVSSQGSLIPTQETTFKSKPGIKLRNDQPDKTTDPSTLPSQPTTPIPATIETNSPEPITAQVITLKDLNTTSDTPEPVPQVYTKENAGSSVYAGLGVFFIILVTGGVILGAFYYRRKKLRLAPTVVYDRDAKLNSDQAILVRNFNNQTILPNQTTVNSNIS